MQNLRSILKPLNSQSELERFTEVVLGDPGLHDRLRGTATEAEFIELAIHLAEERGCRLNPPMLREAINRKRRAWLERWL